MYKTRNFDCQIFDSCFSFYYMHLKKKDEKFFLKYMHMRPRTENANKLKLTNTKCIWTCKHKQAHKLNTLKHNCLSHKTTHTHTNKISTQLTGMLKAQQQQILSESLLSTGLSQYPWCAISNYHIQLPPCLPSNVLYMYILFLRYI